MCGFKDSISVVSDHFSKSNFEIIVDGRLLFDFQERERESWKEKKEKEKKCIYREIDRDSEGKRERMQEREGERDTKG